MDTDLAGRLAVLEQKTEAIFQSVEKTRKYFLVTLWVTLIAFVLPLVIATFAIPAALNSYLGSFSDPEGDVHIENSDAQQMQELLQGLL